MHTQERRKPNNSTRADVAHTRPTKQYPNTGTVDYSTGTCSHVRAKHKLIESAALQCTGCNKGEAVPVLYSRTVRLVSRVKRGILTQVSGEARPKATTSSKRAVQVRELKMVHSQPRNGNHQNEDLTRGHNQIEVNNLKCLASSLCSKSALTRICLEFPAYYPRKRRRGSSPKKWMKVWRPPGRYPMVASTGPSRMRFILRLALTDNNETICSGGTIYKIIVYTYLCTQVPM